MNLPRESPIAWITGFIARSHKQIDALGNAKMPQRRLEKPEQPHEGKAPIDMAHRALGRMVVRQQSNASTALDERLEWRQRIKIGIGRHILGFQTEEDSVPSPRSGPGIGLDAIRRGSVRSRDGACPSAT